MKRVPLSVVIDELEGDRGTRDRAFVRGLCRWFARYGRHVRLDVVERLGLADVVVTFQMKDNVKLQLSRFLGRVKTSARKSTRPKKADDDGVRCFSQILSLNKLTHPFKAKSRKSSKKDR